MNESDDFDFTLFDIILPRLKSSGVKQTYQVIAEEVAKQTPLTALALHGKLMQQEAKATSGIGGGVAIPHLRLKKLSEPFTLLARLPNLVDFNALDDQPVSLVCLLLSPEKGVATHLRRLSRLTRLFRDERLCSQLQDAHHEDTMRAVLLASKQTLRAA